MAMASTLFKPTDAKATTPPTHPYRTPDSTLAAAKQVTDKTVKVFVIDGAGSSGDPYGLGTKVAMKETINKFFADHKIPNIPDVTRPVVDHMGIDKPNHIKRIIEWLKSNCPDIKARYAATPDLEILDARKILALFTTQGCKFILEHSTPVTGMLELAAYLSEHDIKLALNTAYGRDEANAFVTKMKEKGIDFDFVVTSSDVKHSRPSSSMIDRIKDHYGITRDEIIVAGDTPADIRAALDGGYKAIGLAQYSSYVAYTGTESSDELQAKRAEVRTLLQSEGAHYVVCSAAANSKETYTSMFSSIIDDINAQLKKSQPKPTAAPTA